jgi:hypothetical protein
MKKPYERPTEQIGLHEEGGKWNPRKVKNEINRDEKVKVSKKWIFTPTQFTNVFRTDDDEVIAVGRQFAQIKASHNGTRSQSVDMSAMVIGSFPMSLPTYLKLKKSTDGEVKMYIRYPHVLKVVHPNSTPDTFPTGTVLEFWQYRNEARTSLLETVSMDA